MDRLVTVLSTLLRVADNGSRLVTIAADTSVTVPYDAWASRVLVRI